MGKTRKKNKENISAKKPLGIILLRAFALLLIAAFVIGVGANVLINQSFCVTFYQVLSDKVSDNIRIVELADLHNSKYGENNIKLVNKIKALKPDLIFYAGDMMNYKNSDYSVLTNLSDQLVGVAPVYACFGNNELNQYLFEDRDFVKKMESHGVIWLSNESAEVKVKNTVIQLVAVTEGVQQFDVKTNNAKKFVESWEETNNLRVCLTHYPELFNEKLLNRDIDIAFTGHAHGGHIRIPRIGGLYSNGEGFLPKLTSGIMKMDDSTQVVISRGLGNHNPIPRINNQPELVVTDICWY